GPPWRIVRPPFASPTLKYTDCSLLEGGGRLRMRWGSPAWKDPRSYSRRRDRRESWFRSNWVILVAEKPRVLVIGREASRGSAILDGLGALFDVVVVRSVSRAIAMLRESRFDGVYVDASQLGAARWAGMVLQAEEILDAIA